MTDSLPTFAKLGFEVPAETSAQDVANRWFASFSEAIERRTVGAILDLFWDEAYWRDVLALTWDYRTIHGRENIQRLLDARLAFHSMSNLRLRSSPPPVMARPFPDVAWIQGCFDFDTLVGRCSGVVRLVCLGDSDWRAWTMFTNLEDLIGFEESADRTQSEMGSKDIDPVVLVIGAGQAGLCVAARLQRLGIPTLVVERNERVGDNWRHRYSSLSLNDPIWRNHLPYLPFPQSLPVFMTGLEVGDWLESYAEQLGLNVWTSSAVRSPVWDTSAHHWSVTAVRSDGSERAITPKHVVWAVNMLQGTPYMPKITGIDDFKGEIMHSTQHTNGVGYEGKRVIVLGCGMSGHDVAGDLRAHGAQVTMYQRGKTYVMTRKNGIPLLMSPLYWEGGPPTDISDLFRYSIPTPVLKLTAIRNTRRIAELDKDTLDGLRKVGFKVDSGLDDAGDFWQILIKGGGHYVDNGAVTQYIINGDIKIKNNAEIDRFTADGVQFSDGSHLSADLVVFATGFIHGEVEISEVFGSEIAHLVKNAWKLDAEGEYTGFWRHSGHDGLWFAAGNFPGCRFNSKGLALQIKAIEEGLYGTRYTS